MTVSIPTDKQALVEAVKAIGEKFGIQWYPGLFTEAEFEAQLRANYCNYTNFTGERIEHTDEIKDITPSYEELVERFPNERGPYDYEKYSAWINEQLQTGLVFYYADEKENFFQWKGLEQAARLGKKFIIMENLS